MLMYLYLGILSLLKRERENLSFLGARGGLGRINPLRLVVEMEDNDEAAD